MAKFYTPSKLSENIRETPEGFLFCLDVPIARTGYQTYGEDETPLETDDDGEVEIYRSSEEVFRPQTIASFQGKPVTIEHPIEFVTPENWKVLSKGSVQNVRKAKDKDENGEECLLADLLITDALAIQLVKSGLREVSCGYEAEYEQTGTGRGRQINIIGNHLALVEQGRAGEGYAINDHKGKVKNMNSKVLDALRKKFGSKAVDEAMSEETTTDKGYDELVKTMKDAAEVMKTFGEKFDKIEGFLQNKKAKDEEEMEKKPKSKDKDDDKEEAKDKEENESESEILERVKALEAAVSKLLEKYGSEDADEEEKEMKDDDDDEGEEGEEGEESQSKDDDEDPTMTGDAARAEILAPGLSKKVKDADLRKQSLIKAYATKDGKTVIESLAGGKKGFGEALKSKSKVDTLFIAASEVLKHQRGTGLEKTKDVTKFETGDSKTEPMSPEKMNDLNAAHWAKK